MEGRFCYVEYSGYILYLYFFTGHISKWLLFFPPFTSPGLSSHRQEDSSLSSLREHGWVLVNKTSEYICSSCWDWALGFLTLKLVHTQLSNSSKINIWVFLPVPGSSGFSPPLTDLSYDFCYFQSWFEMTVCSETKFSDDLRKLLWF